MNYYRKVNQTTLIRNLDELQHISSQYIQFISIRALQLLPTVAVAATIEFCDAIGRGKLKWIRDCQATDITNTTKPWFLYL